MNDEAAVQPKPVICKIFISRKTEDGSILGEETGIRQELIRLGRDQLKFYDADDIRVGDKWRVELRKLLRGCNLLLLILTRHAKNEFGWPLYEAGLFDGLDDPRRSGSSCYTQGGRILQHS
jgi:hypothetical protein